MNEIKDCPFFGSSKTQVIDDDCEWFGHCAICDARGPASGREGDKKYALELWNKRTNDSCTCVFPVGDIKND